MGAKNQINYLGYFGFALTVTSPCTSRGMSEPEAALIGAASPASEDGTAPTRRGGCGLDLGSVHRFCEARDCWLLWRQSMHTAERQAVHVHRWHGTRPGLEPTSSGSIPVRVSTPFGLDAHEACTPPATEAASERQVWRA